MNEHLVDLFLLLCVWLALGEKIIKINVLCFLNFDKILVSSAGGTYGLVAWYSKPLLVF